MRKNEKGNMVTNQRKKQLQKNQPLKLRHKKIQNLL